MCSPGLHKRLQRVREHVFTWPAVRLQDVRDQGIFTPCSYALRTGHCIGGNLV